MTERKRTHRFTLRLDGMPELTDDQLNDLAEAGCDDGSFGQEGGALIADFDRVAVTFADAVGSARKQIEGAVRGLRVTRLLVDDDDLVTASEIARRADLSREEIRLLSIGKRGPQTFPRPRATLGRQRLWNWPEVTAWFVAERQQRLRTDTRASAPFVRAFNDALDLREQRLAVGSAERAVVNELVRELVRS